VKHMGRRNKYEEPTRDVTVTLPQSAIQGLDLLAEVLNLSGRSELIARIGLGEIPLDAFLGEFSPN